MNFTASRRKRLRANGLFAARYGAFAAVAALVAAGPALAQPGSDSTFTGVHLDVVAGYDDDGVDFDDDVYNGGKQSQSGFVYGFGAGYDYQMGAVTLGVEAELTDSSAGKDRTYSGKRPCAGPAACPPVTTTMRIDAGGDIYVGGRIGWVANPALLIYGKVGYTGHKIAFHGNGTDNTTAYTFDDKVNVHGFRLGIGGEYKFSDMLFGKIEYRYSNYNNGDLDIRGANVNLDPLFRGIDVVRHQFVVGGGVRF